MNLHQLADEALGIEEDAGIADRKFADRNFAKETKEFFGNFANNSVNNVTTFGYHHGAS